DPGMGGLKDKTTPDRLPGTPLIKLIGGGGVAGVVIRHPTRWERRKLGSNPAPAYALFADRGRGRGGARARASAPASARSRCLQAASRLLEDTDPLAERETDEGRAHVPVVVEDRRGDGDDARAFRECPAECDAVGLAQGADVGGDEVGAGGAVHGEPRFLEARRQDVPLGV